MVVPGIGGSVLARPGDPDGAAVWDASKSEIGKGLFHPGRLDIDEPLEPRGLTESTKFLGFTLVPGYELLLKMLEKEGFGAVDRRGDPNAPVIGASVVAVPYDFRRSIVAAAERLDAVVDAHFDGASDAERAKRVIVVAHSMGGLVARVWLGLLRRWPWCRSLITLGTPHRGAPKALGWLVNGVPLASWVTPTLRGWDSVVELLPRYPVVRDGDTDRYPHELDVPCLGRRAKDAYDLHVQIEKLWKAMPWNRPEMVPCIGWSHPTPDACTWENGKLRIAKTPWITAEGWKQDFGDGTVPAYSALPVEMNDQVNARRAVKQRHMPLAHADVIVKLIREQMNYDSPKQAAGPGDEPPAIGLDLDDCHQAGAPIPVAVALRHVHADVSGQLVWARLRAVDSSGPWQQTALSWALDHGGFVGVLPGQPPGLYEVRIRARRVPTAGDLDTTDTVAVVEGG